MDEAKLVDKLRLIEALFAGATTEGEKDAAGRARNRILERLKRLEVEDPPVEYRFTMADMWSRKVFVALLRRYGIRPYRYSRQRYTTVMARVSRRFVNETLWPEFQQISESLRTYLSDVTDRIVHEVIHQDSSEAEVLESPLQLPLALDDAVSAPEPATSPVKPSLAPDEEPRQAPSTPATGAASPIARPKGKSNKRKKRKRR